MVWLVHIYWNTWIQVNNIEHKSLCDSHEGLPLRYPFKRDPAGRNIISWHLWLLHLWNLPQHLHGSHALPRMLLANGWAQWVYCPTWGCSLGSLCSWASHPPGWDVLRADCIWDPSYWILIPPFSSLMSDPHHSQKALPAYSSSLFPWPIFPEDPKDTPLLSPCLSTCPVINDCRIYIYISIPWFIWLVSPLTERWAVSSFIRWQVRHVDFSFYNCQYMTVVYNVEWNALVRDGCTSKLEDIIKLLFKHLLLVCSAHL